MMVRLEGMVTNVVMAGWFLWVLNGLWRLASSICKAKHSGIF